MVWAHTSCCVCETGSKNNSVDKLIININKKNTSLWWLEQTVIKFYYREKEDNSFLSFKLTDSYTMLFYSPRVLKVLYTTCHIHFLL